MVGQEKSTRRLPFNMYSAEPMESSVAGNTRSKTPLAAGILPASWTIYKLADAKTTFATRRPPFVRRKGQLSIGEARRRVALADKQGRLVENPRVAEFAAHSWDQDDFFWTLDLEGTRWIVKANGGGPQDEVTYRKWLGVREGFSEKPVAFSMKQLENEPETLLPPVAFSTQPSDEKTDTIRVLSHVNRTSEEYSDVEVDEVMEAILSDEVADSATASQKARSVVEVIDLTKASTSMPKKQLDGPGCSGVETRFELNRSKNTKKRAGDISNNDNVTSERLSEQAAKRLRGVNGSKPREQEREETRANAFYTPDSSRPNLDIKDTHDMVRSTERASLDPVISSQDLVIETSRSPPAEGDTRRFESIFEPFTTNPKSDFKNEREISHLYSATPPPVPFRANASASVVPASPRPRWLSRRPMGRCRMIAERILADRNRIVRAAGSGCRQCAENSYECITAPGRKHYAFCT